MLTPVRLNTEVPVNLEEIINKALEKDRNLRYQHLSAGSDYAENSRPALENRRGINVVFVAMLSWKNASLSFCVVSESQSHRLNSFLSSPSGPYTSLCLTARLLASRNFGGGLLERTCQPVWDVFVWRYSPSRPKPT